MNLIVFYDFDQDTILDGELTLQPEGIKVPKFLIYYFGNVSSSINITINECQYHLTNFVESDEIMLKTFDVNENCVCEDKIINSFDKETLKWKVKLENYEVAKNYFGCTVFVNPDEHYGSLDFLSLPFEISKIVGRRINFTVAECDGHRKLLEDNRVTTFTKLFDVHGGQFFLIILFYTSINHVCPNTLSAYGFSRITFMITPGEPYTNFEKLYLPFDDETWKYLIITYVSVFSLIVIINRFNRKIQDFFYGQNVTSPAFNVVSIFFGIGQIKLPSGNFARITLMTFIYFCLIIRTAYQGKFLININILCSLKRLKFRSSI
jgi:hypothetical protein